MTYDTKKRIVCTALVALALWPLVHHVTVRMLDLDPWRLFGCSMYTVPPRMLRAIPFSLDDGRALGLAGLPGQQVQHLRSTYAAFTQLGTVFGDHAEPKAFARALFGAYPEVDRIAIYVHHFRVNRATARVEEHHISEPPYRYDRRGVLD